MRAVIRLGSSLLNLLELNRLQSTAVVLTEYRLLSCTLIISCHICGNLASTQQPHLVTAVSLQGPLLGACGGIALD